MSSTSNRVSPARRLLLLLVGLASFGCSSKEIQYPEDHQRMVRIDAAVEKLRAGYVKKDVSKMEAVMLPMDQLEQVQRDAERDFEVFSDIMLEFAIERILIDGDNIDVFVHWHGLWRKDENDLGLRQRGHARLEWVGVQSILLKGVQGDLPFGMHARQATTGIGGDIFKR